MKPATLALFATMAMFATDRPAPNEKRPQPAPPPPPEPRKPAPLPPPDMLAQMKALAIPPVTTRAQRRERAWLARVRESERGGGES